MSAVDLDIDVAALKKQTGQKLLALFYVRAEPGNKGSAMLVSANPRFDGVLTGAMTVPISKE